MKRILIATNKFGHGGVEKTLLTILQNYNQEKYEITIGLTCRGGDLESFIPNYIKIKYFLPFDPMKLNRIISNIFQFILLISPNFLLNLLYKVNNYDSVIAYSGNMIYYIKGFRGKKVCWIHDDWFPFKTQKHILGRFRKYKTIKYLSCCDNVICVSNNLKQMLEEYSGGLLKNVIFLPNAIDPKQIVEFSKETPNFTFNNKEKKYFISVGRLHKIKGFDRLIRAFWEVLSSDKKYELIIVGDGDEKYNLEDMIKKFDAGDRIHLVGYSDNPYSYMAKSDVYVCSSYMEGYSTTISEAMILGKAIISTDCGGSDQILDYGKYGIFVENSISGLKAGIKKIVSNSNNIVDYQKLSLTRATQLFDLDNSMRAIEEIAF